MIELIHGLPEKYGKIRMLYQMDKELDWFTIGAMLEDAKVGRNLNAFEKVAVVSDVDWMNSAVGIFKFIIPFPVRTYKNEELFEAKDWITE